MRGEWVGKLGEGGGLPKGVASTFSAGVAQRPEENPAARDAPHVRCRINKDTEGKSEEVTGPYNQANFPVPVSCPIIDLLRSPIYLLFGLGLTTIPSRVPHRSRRRFSPPCLSKRYKSPSQRRFSPIRQYTVFVFNISPSASHSPQAV